MAMSFAHKPLSLLFLTTLVIFGGAGKVSGQTGSQYQPEYVNFEPAGGTDMVNPLTGDFTYNLPVVQIPGPNGGYTLPVFYHGGIKNEQVASWTGLGWNLNAGAINRFVNVNPDDAVERMSQFAAYKSALYGTVQSVTRGVSAHGASASNTYTWTSFGSKSFSASSMGMSVSASNAKGGGGSQANVYAQSSTMFVGKISIPIGVLFGDPAISVNYGYSKQSVHIFAQQSKLKREYGVLHSNLQANAAQDIATSSDYYENAYKVGNASSISNSAAFPAYDRFSVATDGLAGIFEANSTMKYELSAKNPFPAQKKLFFQFSDEPVSYDIIQPGSWGITNIQDPNDPNVQVPLSEYYPSSDIHDNELYNNSANRLYTTNTIEYFLNEEIEAAKALPAGYTSSVYERGFIETDIFFAGTAHSNHVTARSANPKSIGAFTITNAQGVRYHFSLPVFQYEAFTFYSKSASDYMADYQSNPYVVTWLLTGITGPDYVDRGIIGKLDDEDLGYWVKFNYGKWTEGYIWKTPEEVDASTGYNVFSVGRRDIYYLNEAETSTHKALFIKSERLDSRGYGEDYKKFYRVLTETVGLDDYPCGSDGFYSLGANSFKKEEWRMGMAQLFSMENTQEVPLLKLEKVILIDKSVTPQLTESTTSVADNAANTGKIKLQPYFTRYEEKKTLGNGWKPWFPDSWTVGVVAVALTSGPATLIQWGNISTQTHVANISVPGGNYATMIPQCVYDAAGSVATNLETDDYGCITDLNRPTAVVNGIVLVNPFSGHLCDMYNIDIVAETKSPFKYYVDKQDHLFRNDYFYDNMWDINDVNLSVVNTKSLYTIGFDYNYGLVNGATNSTTGRLTLKKIITRGLHNSLIKPSYTFSYYGETGASDYAPYDATAVDEWGMYTGLPNSKLLGSSYKDIDPTKFTKSYMYSLREVRNQLGGIMTVEYEGDTYAYESIFGKRSIEFPVNDIKFHYVTKPNPFGLNTLDPVQSYFYIDLPTNTYLANMIINNPNNWQILLPQNGGTKMSMSIDLGYCSCFMPIPLIQVNFDNPNQLYISHIVGSRIVLSHNNSADYVLTMLMNSVETYLDMSCSYPQGCTIPSVDVVNEAPGIILTEKVQTTAPLFYGGEIRVKSISMADGTSGSYPTKVSYAYENGSTIYAPMTDLRRFIPFVYELPAPAVLYDKVVISTFGADGTLGGQSIIDYETYPDASATPTTGTTYEIGNLFKVVDLPPASGFGQAINNYISTNAAMAYELVYDQSSMQNIYVGLPTVQYSRGVIVHNGFSELGRINAMYSLDKNQILTSQTEYTYTPLAGFGDAEIQPYIGVRQETYIMRKTTQSENPYNPGHFYESTRVITESSRVRHLAALKSVKITANGLKPQIVSYDEYDWSTGSPSKTSFLNSYNEKITTIAYPVGKIKANGSYVYPWLKSKTLNNSNKNLPGLLAYSRTTTEKLDANGNTVAGTLSVLDAGFSQYTQPGAGNSTWKYRVFQAGSYQSLPYSLSLGVSAMPRSGATYEWKGFLNSDGTLNDATPSSAPLNSGTQASDFFPEVNFAITGAPNTLSPGWVKKGEITLLDEHSHALEAKEVNGHYASSKFGYGKYHRLLFSISNARYVEATFSGMEDPIAATSWFGGEVNGCTTCLTTTPAEVHTGKYAIRVGANTSTRNQEGPSYTATVGSNPENGFQQGRTYRASIWVKPSASMPSTLLPQAKLVCEARYPQGQPVALIAAVALDKATIKAGGWYLLNLDIPVQNLPAGTTSLKVVFRSALPYDCYADDFRMHPIDAPFTAYVYDQETGLVSATLDGDNMATKVEYDAAGQPVKTWIETKDGFKLLQEEHTHFARPLE